MIRHTRRLGLLAAASAAALILAGCASGADTGSGSTSGPVTFEKKDPLTIGYSIYDLQDPYFQSYLAGVKAEAADNDIEVLSFDQKSSEQEQVTGSANLINQGISALIISPIQPDALPATIQQAHAAKIPVIVGDVGAKGDYDVYIQSDNPAGGAQAADYLIDQIKDKEGTKKVAIIGNQPGVVAGEERAAGFKDAIAEDSSIELVGEVAGQTIEAAYKAGQDLLSANPELTAIYATNSNNVQGAARAAAAAGRSDLIIIGFNGDPVELDMIEAGTETATVAQDPYGQGRAAVKAALALLDGEEPEFTDAATKTILFPTQVVNKENLADYRAKIDAQ